MDGHKASLGGLKFLYKNLEQGCLGIQKLETNSPNIAGLPPHTHPERNCRSPLDNIPTKAHTLCMTTYPTHEQQVQQDTLTALRAEMHANQVARANAHNAAKRGYIGRATRGTPSYAITTHNTESR